MWGVAPAYARRAKRQLGCARSDQERAESAAKAEGMWERGHAGYAQPGGGVHIDTLCVRSVQVCEPNARVVAAEHHLAEQAQRP